VKFLIGYIIFTIAFALTVYSTELLAASLTNVQGSNTSIEGGYTGGATTYQDGSSSNTTSTTNSTSNMKSAPGQATAPGMNTTTNCALALSGGVQTFSIGVSGGKHVIDKTCELIALSKTLNQMNMKVAALSLLCSNKKVWIAMYHAQTYCPTPEGFIGAKAKEIIDTKYNGEMPTYEKYLALKKQEKNKIKIKKLKPSK